MNSIKKMLKLRSLHRNIKAVSPVIATIIIVAIAITMSIAVAYWMLGLGSSFTKYEKVEFTTAYVDVSGKEYVITMNLRNTGSAAATIDPTQILYNGKPSSAYDGWEPVTNPVEAFTMDPGQSKNGITITLNGAAIEDEDSPWQSGMSVEITLHTTGGKDYPKVITLP